MRERRTENEFQLNKQRKFTQILKKFTFPTVEPNFEIMEGKKIGITVHRLNDVATTKHL